MHLRPSVSPSRRSRDRVPTVRPGQVVTGRLPSSRVHSVGKPDFASWKTVDSLRGADNDACEAIFGSALATGTVTRVICERPVITEIQRPSGKTAVVLVTRVHGEAA